MFDKFHNSTETCFVKEEYKYYFKVLIFFLQSALDDRQIKESNLKIQPFFACILFGDLDQESRYFVIIKEMGTMYARECARVTEIPN